MLQIDIPTIVFEIINYLVLSVLLYFLLFRRVMERVRQRAEEKRRIMAEIREERESAREIRNELESRLERLHEEVDEILSDAQEKMEEERKKILQSAREEAERILETARSEAEQLQRRTMEEHQDQLLDVIMEVCADILRQITPDECNDRLFQDINNRIWELGKKEMDLVDVIRRSFGERSPTINVETAKKLSTEQKRKLAKTLSALIDRDVDLELTIDPQLALGMRIRLGDLVINNSIASELDQMRESISERLTENLPYE